MGFQFQMGIPASRATHMSPIEPILIIRDIIPPGLILDGVVIEDTITTIILGIGGIIGQATITKAIPIAINEIINVGTTINTMETINAKVAMETAGDDKLIVTASGMWAG